MKLINLDRPVAKKICTMALILLKQSGIARAVYCLFLLMTFYIVHMTNHTSRNIVPRPQISHYTSSNVTLGTLCEIHNKLCVVDFQQNISISRSSRVFVLKSNASLVDTLRTYNKVIAALRKRRKISTNETLLTSTLEVNREHIHTAYGLDYFAEIFKGDNVETLLLKWIPFLDAHMVSEYLPIKHFYPSQMPPDEQCDSKDTNPYCKEMLERSIHANPSTILPYTLQTTTSVQKRNKTYLGYPEYALYLHFIHGGYVDTIGNVFTGNLDIVPFQCRENTVNRSLTDETQFIKEVFVISHYWGSGYFHSMIEVMPRIAAYVDFLKAHPSIRIHTVGPCRAVNFAMIGLDPARMIWGPVKAGLIYLPQGGGCGWLHPLAGQILHQHYQQYIHSNWPQLQQDTIVLVKRSYHRKFGQHKEVATMMSAIAQEHKLNFKTFADNPPPPMNTTAQLFARARLVIAPHGAGLSNMIFARPETPVMEVLCNPDWNGCFWAQCTNLGQRYFGLLANLSKKCEDTRINLDFLRILVTNILKSSNVK